MLSLGIELTKKTSAWRSGVLHVLEPFGLTLSPYLMLYALYTLQFELGHSPSQKEAANFVGLDLNVASQSTKLLVSHHLVNRQHNDVDTRAYVLSLTLAGEQLAKTAGRAVESFESEFFGAKQHSG